MFWKTIATFLLDYLVKKLPGLINDHIIKPASDGIKRAKRRRKDKKKIKAHKDAKSKKDKINTFNRLP